MGTQDDDEMHATLFPSPNAKRQIPLRKDSLGPIYTDANYQRPSRDGTAHRHVKGVNHDNFTSLSTAGEWTASYDDVVSAMPARNVFTTSAAEASILAQSAPSQYDGQHMMQQEYQIRGDSNQGSNQEQSRRSPTKVAFVPQTDEPIFNLDNHSRHIIQDSNNRTRRANASPTRQDMRLKPLPESPLLPRASGHSSFESNSHYSYLMPRPLNVPTRKPTPYEAQAGRKNERENTEEPFNWFKANNLPQPAKENPRETVWFQPQPPTRYFTGDPTDPFTYEENPPIMFRQTEGGPIEASIDGVPIPHAHTWKTSSEDRELATMIMENHEHQRAQRQSMNKSRDHNTSSGDTEYEAFLRASAETTGQANAGPLTESQNRKHSSHSPRKMSAYDQIMTLEHMPGGRSRVARKGERSSSSTNSEPRGRPSRPTVRTQRSRSLSPFKKPFDFGRRSEDADDVFCGDDLPQKRSRSPMKQMFGENGWLHRGNSMNQVATPSPRKKGFKDLAKLVRQKTDEKVNMISLHFVNDKMTDKVLLETRALSEDGHRATNICIGQGLSDTYSKAIS